MPSAGSSFNVNFVNNSSVSSTVPLFTAGRHNANEVSNYNFDATTTLDLNAANPLFVEEQKELATPDDTYTVTFAEGVKFATMSYPDSAAKDDNGLVVVHSNANGAYTPSDVMLVDGNAFATTSKVPENENIYYSLYSGDKLVAVSTTNNFSGYVVDYASKIVLNNDVEYAGSDNILVNNDLTVDLNKKTFTFKVDYRFSVNSDGINFVLENGDVVARKANVVFMDKASTATLNNVNITNGNRTNALFDVRKGELVVNGGKFEIGAQVINAHSRVTGPVKVEFNGVDIITTANPTGALYVFGTLCTHKSAPADGYVADTEYVLNNCTIDSKCDYLYAYGRHMNADSTLSFKVNGGSIKTATGVIKYYTNESECNCNFVGNANAKVLNASFSDVYLNHVPEVEYGTLTYGAGNALMSVEGNANGFNYYVGKPTPDAIDANLSLYSDFTLNLYVPVSSNVSGIADAEGKSLFVTDETTGEKVVVNVNGADCYVAQLKDIAPTNATNKVSFRISFTKDGEIRTVSAKYSVLNYAKDFLNSEAAATDTAGTTLVKDTLLYVKAATVLAAPTADVSAVDELLDGYNRKAEIPENTETVDGANGYISGATFDIVNNVTVLKLALVKNDCAITVNGIEATTEGSYAYVELRAFMLVDSLRIYADGNYVGTYSLASYYNSDELQGAGANTIALVEALYAYAESARAYKTVNA